MFDTVPEKQFKSFRNVPNHIETDNLCGDLRFSFKGLVTIVLACQFVFLVRHFFLYVPASRRVATLWVNSVYLIVSIATVFCVILPQSSDFVWLFYRVYLGMAMGYFVDLTLAWYGGESEMLR